MQTKQLSQDTEGYREEYITAISSKDYATGPRELPVMSIQIPSELIEATSSGEVVRVVSFLYYNITHLFPGGEQQDNE